MSRIPPLHQEAFLLPALRTAVLLRVNPAGTTHPGSCPPSSLRQTRSQPHIELKAEKSV